MKKHSLSLNFTAYDSPEELLDRDLELLEEAKAALGKAYAPYSNFQVGAAARLANGVIVSGANCENASYPLCICAEPATLAAAASQHPGVAVVAMAITVASANQPVDQPATPCGACRQMLVEHEQRFRQSIRLILRGQTGPVYVFDRVADILPLHFDADFL